MTELRVVRDPRGSLEATYAPRLGMICSSLLHGGEQVLGLRDGLAAYEASASTMGIPLLHPWANRIAGPGYEAAGKAVSFDIDSPLVHTDPGGLPIHGAAPTALGFDPIREADGRLEARLDVGPGSPVAQLFPFPHRLTMEVAITGSVMEVTTILEATGSDAVPVAFGFHPYFQLPGAPRSGRSSSQALRTHMILDERLLPTGAGVPAEPATGPVGDRTWDDLYGDVQDGDAFSVAAAGRRLTIRMVEGYRFAQVFAPPGGDVICFEPMTAPGNALVTGIGLRVLQPGERHRAVFAIELTTA